MRTVKAAFADLHRHIRIPSLAIRLRNASLRRFVPRCARTALHRHRNRRA